MNSVRISLTENEIDELQIVLTAWRRTCIEGDFDFRLNKVEVKLDEAKKKIAKPRDFKGGDAVWHRYYGNGKVASVNDDGTMSVDFGRTGKPNFVRVGTHDVKPA